MTEEGTTARGALALALKDCDAAQRDAVKSREAVTAAASKFNEAERHLREASTALEEARAPQRRLAQLLAEAASDEERQQLVDEHNSSKGRPAVTAEDLREARVLVLDAEDRVVVARSELEQLQSAATSATAAANRANDRRREAIHAVVRPEAIRLMERVQRLTRELADARLSLKFVGANLVNEYGDERRQISRTLDRDLASLFPEEFGYRAEPSTALAAWKAFAESVTRDASTPFPST